MGSITFPAMDIKMEAKVKHLMDKIGEYMGADISIETCIVMKVIYPDERENDVGCIIQTILNRWKEKA